MSLEEIDYTATTCAAVILLLRVMLVLASSILYISQLPFTHGNSSKLHCEVY